VGSAAGVVRAAVLGWRRRPIGGGGGAGRWPAWLLRFFLFGKTSSAESQVAHGTPVPRASEVALGKEPCADPAVSSRLCREYSGLCREELALGTTPDSGSDHQPFVDCEMEDAAHARRACTSGMLLRLHRWRHITTASRCELDVLLLTTIYIYIYMSEKVI
jgi:hypothetical protein